MTTSKDRRIPRILSSVLALSVAVVLVSCGSPIEQPPQVGSDATAPTSMPTATPDRTEASRPHGDLAVAWSDRLTLPVPQAGPGLERRAMVNDVAFGPSGWVAVGSTMEYEEREDVGLIVRSLGAMAWLSADGIRWEAAPAAADMDDGIMQAVVAVANGYVAVGREELWTDDGTGYYGEGPVAWRSNDGVVWQRGAGLMGTGRLKDVAYGDGMLVAVGCIESTCFDGPAVWTSADGGEWHQVPDLPTRQPAGYSGIGKTGALDAAGFADGQFLAGGYLPGSDDDPREATLWRSEDGTTWEEVELPDSLDQAISAFADGGGWTVATGSRIWRSSDLVTWEAPPEAQAQDASDIAWSGSAFVALGWWNPQAETQVWVSTDGLVWERRAIWAESDGRPMARLAIGDGLLMAVGGHVPDIGAWSHRLPG